MNTNKSNVDNAYSDNILDSNWSQFKLMSKELLDALPTLDYAGIDNGRKALGLAYLNLKLELHESHQAPILLKLVMIESLKYELMLDL